MQNMLTYNITKLGRNTEETEMATGPADRQPKNQTDGPEKLLSGIRQLTISTKNSKESMEDQPKDGRDDLNDVEKDDENGSH